MAQPLTHTTNTTPATARARFAASFAALHTKPPRERFEGYLATFILFSFFFILFALVVLACLATFYVFFDVIVLLYGWWMGHKLAAWVIKKLIRTQHTV